MKIFLLHADHQSTPGHILRAYATKELADVGAAELVNMILKDYEEDNEPLIAPDATAETWMVKCLEYRKSIADDLDIDMDDLKDDDAGDVWIVETDLIGLTARSFMGFDEGQSGGDVIVHVETVGRNMRAIVMKPWYGGEPPLPAGTSVIVNLRHGGTKTGHVGQGYATRWTHTGGADDIVAYALYIPDTGLKSISMADLGEPIWSVSVDLRPGKTTDAVGIDDAAGMGKTEGER